MKRLPDWEIKLAEFLKEKGVVDIVVERKEMRDTVARVIDLLMRKQDPAKVIPIDRNLNKN